MKVARKKMKMKRKDKIFASARWVLMEVGAGVFIAKEDEFTGL